jgi:hypothetical protein
MLKHTFSSNSKSVARITGTPLIMQSAVVDIVTIPAGKIGIESQFHITIGENNKPEFELVDRWLVLNDDLVKHTEAEKYSNFLELCTGRDLRSIYSDAESAAEELIRSCISYNGGILKVG